MLTWYQSVLAEIATGPGVRIVWPSAGERISPSAALAGATLKISADTTASGMSTAAAANLRTLVTTHPFVDNAGHPASPHAVGDGG
ncbi:hypothetical protein GCM10009530_10590 [Microbispora corallina]|uniref:Uncharacterized protein n=1 Tax=Microbispora corallina TaxID=83302 RepID=A0ABQ4FW36_9ACTN|nr:hypothetical protein Mco01_20220 [Microbispora corallina]